MLTLDLPDMGRTFLYIFFLLHGGSASYLAIIISCRLYFLLLSPVNNTPSSSSSPGMHGCFKQALLCRRELPSNLV
jgi:hypothetical protein